MRTVLLVRDSAPCWLELDRMLFHANARVVMCAPDEVVAALQEAKPNLVILDEAAHRAHEIRRPQIIVRPGSPTPVQIVDGARPPRAFIGWPIPEEMFLELTARMLRVAERRTFRALIRILRPRVRESFMATSEDFSLTGMALRTDQRLERGETILVSMHLPGGKSSLQLLAEVTRESTHPADGSPYFGVRFVNLDEPTRSTLGAFIRDELVFS